MALPSTPVDAASILSDPLLKPKLDVSLYSLEADELAFFRQLTKIQDEEELKAHIVDVQAKAYEIYGYPCIRRFAFIKLKIARLPGYKEALKLLHERKDPILLDIGCCFGNDARKAVVDGWPVKNVLASDLRIGFWNYGHELFKSTPETFPAAFIAGDAFDSSFLAPRAPFIDEDEIASTTSNAAPSLHDITSLIPLQGKVSAIHASAFFHLFQEEHQLDLARRLASLLSPEKGSVIFGQHGSKPVKGYRTEFVSQARIAAAIAAGAPASSAGMFCHSPETWQEMWVNDVFGGPDEQGRQRIKVDTELIEVQRTRSLENTTAAVDIKFHVLNWCVTRL